MDGRNTALALTTASRDPRRRSQPSLHPARPIRPIPTHLPTSSKIASASMIVFLPMPEELWHDVFGHLEVDDMKNVALTCRHISGFARANLRRRVRLPTTLDFFGFYFLAMRPVYDEEAIVSITLTVSPLCIEFDATSESVLAHWRRLLPRLRGLKEVTFLGKNIPPEAQCDVLDGLSSSARLFKFYCEDDGLLHASWPSVSQQAELKEFGGFFSTIGAANCPQEVSPDVFPRLRILDTSTAFALRLGHSSGVTHLRMRMEWHWALDPTLRYLSELVGPSLLSLRIDRTFVDPRRLLWGHHPIIHSDSPVWPCASLDAPALRYFEVRDVITTVEPAHPVPEALGSPFWAQLPRRVPGLKKLVWRPAWASEGGRFQRAAESFSQAVGQILPVLAVTVSLEADPRGACDEYRRTDDDVPFKRDVVWGAVGEESWKKTWM